MLYKIGLILSVIPVASAEHLRVGCFYSTPRSLVQHVKIDAYKYGTLMSYGQILRPGADSSIDIFGVGAEKPHRNPSKSMEECLQGIMPGAKHWPKFIG